MNSLRLSILFLITFSSGCVNIAGFVRVKTPYADCRISVQNEEITIAVKPPDMVSYIR